MKIIKEKTKPKGLRIVVYGTHGIGKTTLASKLPGALFFDYENGTHGIEVAKATDIPRSFSTLNAAFAELTRDKQGFRNLIIDSADKLEEILDKSSCEGKAYESVFTVNDYGRTVSGFTSNFGQMLDNASKMVDSGMNIMFIAHEQTRKCEPLEGSGAYDHHELKLSKGNTKLLMQWADVVIYTAYKTFAVKDDETKKVRAGGGKRWCFTVYKNDWEAKHRACIELPDDCSLDKMAEILPKALADAVDSPVTKAAPKKKEVVATVKEETVEPEKKDSPSVATFKKLLGQYAVEESRMRTYAASKLNDRYGMDFKTAPLDEWPEEALNWLNRGFDKIITKLN